MANITRNFTAGKMNKMVDDRLVPNGEYIDALNVRMGSSEGSDIGTIENSKGNTPLTALAYEGTSLSSSARCIGAFEDGASETLYWFVHDGSFPVSSKAPLGIVDMVVSYNTTNSILIYLAISVYNTLDTTKTTLNFNSKYLITGINKIENLLFFTDNYNAPRQINVSKNYENPVAGVDKISGESLLVIKKPPLDSPVINPISTSSQDNFLENRFICFAYRYRYEDGEYSATSQFSNPSFIPNVFEYNPNTALNSGMLNTTNMCDITYNSGGPLVKSIDLLFKDMNSSIIKVIEKLDKEKDGLADDADYTYTFNNSKIFTILPTSEILRFFDNVPLLSQAQTMIGNRLIYGNYLEGFNLVRDNVPTKLEYFVTATNEDVGRNTIEELTESGTYTFDTNQTISNSVLDINLGGQNLAKGALLNIFLRFEHSAWSGDAPNPTMDTQETSISFTYILPQNFSSVYELATSIDFAEKIGNTSNISSVVNSCTGTTFTDLFNCIVPNELLGMFKYQSGISGPNQPISIIASTGSQSIKLQLPAMKFVDDQTGASITKTNYEYYKINVADVVYQEVGNPSSLHSNRGYEIGILYMDEFNRSTTALVSPNNTVHIPCSNSETKNVINVNIPTTQIAPEWATRYKFVIKPDKEGYDVIYSNLFFNDPTSGADFFLLDGQNSQKIQEGDEMIVKTDTEGPRDTCTWTTVLEKKAQLVDFLDPPPSDSNGNDISLPAGVYMKLRANNFSTVTGDYPVITSGEVTGGNGTGCRIVNYPLVIPGASAGTFIDFDVPAGSRITIKITNDRRGNEEGLFGNVGKKYWKVDNTFTASQDYASFQEWFEQDNISAALNSAAFTDGTDVTGPNYSSTVQPVNNRPCESNAIYTNFQALTGGGHSFGVKSSEGYSGKKKRTRLSVEIIVIRSSSLLVFESDPKDSAPDLWYESSKSYPVDSIGQHTGTVQNQVFSSNTPAIVATQFFNCYAFGNGVESYKIQDSTIGKEIVLGNRATTTNAKDFRAERRLSDLTYSGVYNAESNINKLNEFNQGLLNFKPLEQSFGPIMKLFGRETDILTLQEDKISYVLQGKNILSDAGGGNVLTAVPEVLGLQVARIEEFGISHNPESFAQWGPDKFFTDAKRGVALKLTGAGESNDSLKVISAMGMRPWFRDLFNVAFKTQKLGGFDPYMNEFVLSTNTIKIPVDTECIDCGITASSAVSITIPYEACYKLGVFVGDVDIDYSFGVIEAGKTVTVSGVYNGVTYTTGDVIVGGQLVINKSLVQNENLDLTISTTSIQPITITFTVKCPDADIIKIVLVHLSSINDGGLQIHDEYRWKDGAFVSPLHTEQVVFSSGTAPIVSLYETIIGQQGGGVIPTNNSVVTMMSNKIGSDTYNFDTTQDDFKYIRTNTVYPNTSAGIADLLAAASTATPIVLPINGNTAYSADFSMPSSGENLYLLWDYRNSTPLDLCFGASSTLACCACIGPAPVTYYDLVDCDTGLYWSVEDIFGVAKIGDVVQYKQGIGANQSTMVYCGEIVSLGTIANATQYSEVSYFCGDTVHCGIIP
tara:strand:- start:9420 stop:14069 length:4650 start_codon:yes stop_codon:yes gene_type:complete